MLESGSLTDSQRRKYTAALRKLCGNRGILPTSHTITDDLNKVGELPIAGGGFAEVWEGNHRGRRVAIKVFRLYSSKDQTKVKKLPLIFPILNIYALNIHQRFCKEAIIWKRLSHPNVLPFIDIATSPFKFCMVSPWMANGDVIVYLNSHPQANPLRILSSRPFMRDL
jgi:serine/threonine protein kinase